MGAGARLNGCALAFSFQYRQQSISSRFPVHWTGTDVRQRMDLATLVATLPQE